MPLLSLEVYQELTGWKSWSHARTQWKDYISHVASGRAVGSCRKHSNSPVEPAACKHLHVHLQASEQSLFYNYSGWDKTSRSNDTQMMKPGYEDINNQISNFQIDLKT